MPASILEANPATRLATAYQAPRIPSMGEAGSTSLFPYPTSVDGLIRSVETDWLGTQGPADTQRHIENGILRVKKESGGYSLAISAMTKSGQICPIVWGVSVTRENPEDDILEPHVLVPENMEVKIRINTEPFGKIAILGAYDQPNPQAGLPPLRTGLLVKNGVISLYEGDEVVIWDYSEAKPKWGYPRASSAVKIEGDALALVDEASAEAVLHGGIYVMVYPEKPKPEVNISRLLGGSRPNSFGGKRLGDDNFKGGDILNLGTRGGATKSWGGESGRVADIGLGDIVDYGHQSDMEPDYTKGTPIILRVRTTGELTGYLSAATVATAAESAIIIKRALCGNCGANAPSVKTSDGQSQRIYEWKGNNFSVTGDFQCGHCGGVSLEPVVYRKPVPRKPTS